MSTLNKISQSIPEILYKLKFCINFLVFLLCHFAHFAKLHNLQIPSMEL